MDKARANGPLFYVIKMAISHHTGTRNKTFIYACFLLCFLQYLWFLRNFGSMPLVEEYFCFFCFLILLSRREGKTQHKERQKGQRAVRVTKLCALLSWVHSPVPMVLVGLVVRRMVLGLRHLRARKKGKGVEKPITRQQQDPETWRHEQRARQECYAATRREGPPWGEA